MTEDRVADAADDEQLETGSGNSSSGSRSSDTPRPSSVASATPSNSREQALPSRKRTKRDVTELLVSFLDVERREAREQKIDVIMLYQSRIADLRHELRDSREECRVFLEKVDDLRYASTREMADLTAEKDRGCLKCFKKVDLDKNLQYMIKLTYAVIQHYVCEQHITKIYIRQSVRLFPYWFVL
ncbi:hypothetical protein V1505DRAFT_57926 [Lipomyces doorenjongii]